MLLLVAPNSPQHDGTYFVQYQLTPEELFENGALHVVAPAQIELVELLTDDDQCWLEVFSFSSTEQAGRFTKAISRLLPDHAYTMLGKVLMAFLP